MTVAEMIALLQAMPQDAQVFVHDADTEWLLPVADNPYHGAAVRLDDDQVVIQSAGY